MKAKELKTKARGELNALLREKRERLRVLRFELAGGKIKNVREVRETKKDIARMLTLLKTI